MIKELLMRYKLITPSIIICLQFSCSGSKTETANQTQDSVSSNTVAVSLEPPVPVYNPADSGTFKGFIDLCKNPSGPLPEWAASFVSNDAIGRYNTQELLETEPNYLLLYLQFMPVGPGVDKLWAVSFNKDGQMISEAELGESYPSSGPDGGGKDFKYSYDKNKKVLKISDITTEWSEDDQQELTDESWYYYYLDADGNIVAGRKYPFVSQQLLVAQDLERYSKDELKIMRNEIFAVYGYIFKTEPLKSHFAAQVWYTGDTENVDDYLTKTEKANVALIKEVEEQK